MKRPILQLAAICSLAFTLNSSAMVLYVDLNSTNPIPPYADWSTAATNIQDAVDAAADGDQVLVTNGVYQTGGKIVYGALTNRVAVTRAITVQSVNGPAVTVIEGCPQTEEYGFCARCVYLTNNAILQGFTLTNGATTDHGDWSLEQSGGGVWCENSSAVISNCIMTYNIARAEGGGAYGGTFNNCTFTGNWAVYYGGGASQATLNNCMLIGGYAMAGGGAYAGTLNNCTISSNSAYWGGGANGNTLTNCSLTDNSSEDTGGGAYESTLYNCLLEGNSAGSEGGGAVSCTLNNCGLTANSANQGGGIGDCTANQCTLSGNSASEGGGGASASSLNNSIVYYNVAPVDPNYTLYGEIHPVLNNCCTTPLPPNGTGNITVEPLLADFAHLSAESPCRGAGDTAYSTGVDIDGEAWLTPPSIGCDEFSTNAITGPLTVAIQSDYTNVTPGFPVNFIGQITGHATSNVWDFGDGTAATNLVYVSHHWLVAGDYPVAFTAFNDSYPGGVSATLLVHVAEEIHYVDIACANPVPPFTSWGTAATNIQDAVDAAVAPGTRVMVTNGIYASGGRAVGALTNRLVIARFVQVQSVNGPSVTVIQGHQQPGTINGDGAVRCVYLTDTACLAGFTLMQGATRSDPNWWIPSYEKDGGGVWCETGNSVVSNCVFTANSAVGSGGGIYGGMLFDSVLTNNTAGNGGGANNCTLNNSVLVNNSAGGEGGGAVSCTLNNCGLTANSANQGGGIGDCTANHCTLTGNSASEGGGAYNATLNNSIVYYNNAANGTNYSGSVFNFSCTIPLPDNGTNNITVEPLLADPLHLSAGSPCLGAGDTNDTTGVDIDGELWAVPPSMGCDEFYPGSITGPLAVAILQGKTYVVAGYEDYFTATVYGHASANVWDFGDGTIVSNRLHISHAWAAIGDYTVVFRAGNDSYPDGVSATTMVHVATRVIYYVNASGTNSVAPYYYWVTAATNIQDAIDVADADLGGTVLVTNGVYQTGGRAVSGYLLTNRVTVDKTVSVESVNGPAATVIQGHQEPDTMNGSNAMRCVYLVNGARLAGFTLTQGATRPDSDWRIPGYEQNGGGVLCDSGDCVVSNCVFSSNSAVTYGSAVFGGTVFNSVMTNNTAFSGTAAYSTLNKCLVADNNAANDGGGVFSCTLNNCVLRNNVADIGGAALWSTLDNCTLTGNSAGNFGGGIFDCTLTNCIVYYNTSPSGGNFYYTSSSSGSMNYCCTTPNPNNGVGNITSAPLFVNQAGNNLRLQTNSPCINAGNNAFAAGNTDLDGRARIVGGTVDMGAFEFQGAGMGEFIGWLQQYGLLTDGTMDYSDSDGDGMNNWQEWIAGTIPTNALSVLRLTSPAHNSSGFVVTWQSVSNRIYCIERSSNLSTPGSFLTLATNIVGQPGTTSYTDTNALGSGPFFYRVGIQTDSYQVRKVASIIPFTWLQQYGLPTDGSADYADTDGDGMNNWQEWRSGTSPLDSSSLLKMLTASKSVPGLTVRWQSVNGINYFLQSSTNLGAQPAFSTIQSNIAGQAGTTSYTDTTATNGGPYFYRVGVQ